MTKVACSHCNGAGWRALTRTEQHTLDAVPSHWGDTSEVAADVRGVKPTALINRLTRLWDLGLVETRQHPTNGRMLQWRRRP